MAPKEAGVREHIQALARRDSGGGDKVDCIDFLGVFLSNSEYNACFSHVDAMHWIDEGQEIVAERIFRKIRRRLNEKRREE